MGQKPKTLTSFVAGAGAGVVARTFIAPVERVKILFQVARGGAGYIHYPATILRNEGVLAFWKGNTAAIVRVIPYRGLMFLAYEESKARIAQLGAPKQATSLLAGSFAGVTAVSVTYPLDLVRAAMAKPDCRYPSMLGALHTIAAERGIGALYAGGPQRGARQLHARDADANGEGVTRRSRMAGISATLLGVAPYAGLTFASYEGLKGSLGSFFGLHEDDLRAWQRVGAGAVAGLMAQTAIYPLDVVRRRMQTHEGRGQLYRSPLHALRTIAREEGVRRGLYRGLSLTYLKTMPDVAIYMSLYDILKLQLDRHQKSRGR